MDFSEQNREIRVAAGCGLGCVFCTLGEGREGITPLRAMSGDLELVEGRKILVLAGNLIDAGYAGLAEKLKRDGAEDIIFYAHSGPCDPNALKALAKAGMTGIHLVLPSARRETLSDLTSGRGSLKMVAILLAGARELGLDVTLDIPVVDINAQQVHDTVERAARLAPISEVILNFVSRTGPDRKPIRWDPATSLASVKQTIEFCRENNIVFGIGRSEAPPPCILPLENVPAGAWGDLAGSPMNTGTEEVRHPFAACDRCVAKNICRFTARHLAPAAEPRPLTASSDAPSATRWLDAAAIWIRRNELRDLRLELMKRQPACLNPWTNLETHSVRGVAICCATHRFQYGTVDQCVSWHDTSLRQAWNSQVMQSVRHQMKIGQPHVHCRPDCVAFHGGGPGDSWLTADPLTDAFHGNLVKNLQEILDGAEILESLPQNLVIAPSLHCNIACVMCRFPGEVKDAPDPSKTMMSERQYDEVIEMMPYLRVLNITGGEPLIADGTRRLLRAFKTDLYRDGGIAITTNGILLDQSLISDMKKSRLLSVIISVNAANRETYQHVTGVDAFDRVMRNIGDLTAARRDFNPVPRIVLSFVIMKCNYRQIPDHIRTAARFGTDIQLLPMVGRLGNESMFMDPDNLNTLSDFIDTEVAPLVIGMKQNFRREVATLQSTIRRRIIEGDYSMF